MSDPLMEETLYNANHRLMCLDCEIQIMLYITWNWDIACSFTNPKFLLPFQLIHYLIRGPSVLWHT